MTEKTDLARFFSLIRSRLLLITVVTSLFVGLSLAYAILATPMYRSFVLVAPTQQAEDSGGLGALASQFGGLASLAGVQVGGGAQKDQAIAILRSRRFTEAFIANHSLMNVLFDEEWDQAANAWQSDLSEGEVPTMADAVRLLDTKIRSVSEDSRTGLVTVSIVWKDRVQAADWANNMIDELNSFMKSIALKQAEANISFLHKELDTNSLVQVRQAIFRLIEQQVELSMLANTRSEYAFEVLDPAVAADADDEYWPMRAIIVILGAIFGVIMGILFALTGQAIRPKAL